MAHYLYRHIRLDKNIPFYIGIGTIRKNANSEKQQYSRAYFRAKNKVNSIWRSIVSKTKYRVEILFESKSRREIIAKEKEFIELYGRIDLKNGILSNMTEGGDGRNKICDREKKRMSRECIFNNIKGKKHFKSKPIYQYTLSGRFIKKWESMNSIEMSKGYYHYAIRLACNSDTKTAYGYQWYWKDMGKKVKPRTFNPKIKKGQWVKNKYSRAVEAFDFITNKLLGRFESEREAERTLGVQTADITKICKGIYKQTNGITFKFI